MAKDHNAKVTRWRLGVQDYNFDLVYVKESDNKVADAWSRLCPTQNEEEDEEITAATVSLNTLNANWQKIDEWIPRRNDSQSDETHIQYEVEEGQYENFKNLKVQVYCQAIHTSYIPANRSSDGN